MARLNTAASIFDASNKGDKLALIIMNEVINWFGIGISNIILMYDPQIMIVQGIFTKAGKYFLESSSGNTNGNRWSGYAFLVISI